MTRQENYWTRITRNQRLGRRQLLLRGSALATGAGALLAVGCGGDDDDSGDPSATSTTSGQASPTTGQGAHDPNAKVAAGFTFVHDSMDPHDVTLPPYGIPFRAIFDALTYRQPDSTVSGGLAASWEAIDAGTYVFKLNPDAKWHNGDPFTADDVVFTHDRVNADKKAARNTLGAASIEVVDPQTLRLTLPKPDAVFPQAIADIAILPKKYVESVGGMDGFVKAPVGTGRFKLGEFRGGDLVRIERVEDGWRPKPNVAEVTMRVIPDNATRIAALESGQIMIANSLPPETVGQFDGNKNIAIQAGLLPNVLTIDLLDTNTADVRVRRAMNLAVNNQGIVDQLFAGKGQVVAQAVGSNAFGYNEKLEPFPFDQAEAKRLLEAAGVGNGFETTLTHSTAIAGESLAAEAIVGFLGQVGIKVNLVTIEPTVRLNNFQKGSPEPLFTWAGGYANLMDAAASLFYYKSNTGFGQVRYKNPEFDRLYEDMRADVDNDSRFDKITRLNEMLREDVPVLWEFTPASFLGVSTKLFDLEQRGDGHVEFANVKVRA